MSPFQQLVFSRPFPPAPSTLSSASLCLFSCALASTVLHHDGPLSLENIFHSSHLKYQFFFFKFHSYLIKLERQIPNLLSVGMCAIPRAQCIIATHLIHPASCHPHAGDLPSATGVHRKLGWSACRPLPLYRQHVTVKPPNPFLNGFSIHY